MRIITKDLFEASFLLTKGMQLEHVFGDRQTVLFQFEGGDHLQVLKGQYDQASAYVNVHHFKKNLTHLKDIMFSKIRNQNPVSYRKRAYRTASV